MKRLSLLLPLCLAFIAASCASSPPATIQPATAPQPPVTLKSEIWPKIYADESYLATFASTWSAEEAIGTIRNLQNSVVEFNAGLPISELSVDPYGMRANWSWTETNSVVKSASFIIPFDQVASMLLEHYPTLEKDFKWGLLISLTTGSSVSVRTPTRDAAERLGKAILVLASARGSKVSLPDSRFGAALGPLSEAQAQAAGILQSSGIIVSWIFKESPAEKAGLSPQDIITGIDGKPVQKADDLFSAINAAAAVGAKELKITGIRRSYKIEGSKYVEIFVPVFFTLEIAQTGASQ
ncbi:MAG: PDZ domain-containing protein [Spirochaetaceae bacterium]|nr:PDZ domain-containing protein [Spirochaetaceae bacterium]